MPSETTSSNSTVAYSGRSFAVESLVYAVKSISALPPVPLADWGCRASAGVASAFGAATVCVALIDTRTWRPLHSGSGRSQSSANDPRELLHTLRTHVCLRHASPTHGLQPLAWDDERHHPFAKAGFPAGLVLRSVHSITPGVLLAFWVHAPADSCPVETARVLNVLCDFIATTARTLWDNYGPTPRWLTAAETDVLERLALKLTSEEPAEPETRRELTIRNHVRSIASKTGLTTPEQYAAALGPIAAANTLRSFASSPSALQA